MKEESWNSNIKRGCKPTIKIFLLSSLWWIILLVCLYNVDFASISYLKSVLLLIVSFVSLLCPLIIYYIEKKITLVIQNRKEKQLEKHNEKVDISTKIEAVKLDNAVDDVVHQEHIKPSEEKQIEPIIEDSISSKEEVLPNEINFLNKNYNYKYVIYNDPFTKGKEIQWKISTNHCNDERNENIGCSLASKFIYKNILNDELHFHLRIEEPQLGFRFNIKEVFVPHQLVKGDTLSFLFDDGTILKYTLKRAPCVIGGNGIADYDRKKYREIRFDLTNNDAQQFATHLITHYKLDCQNGDATQLYNIKYIDNCWIIRHHFQVYLNILGECGVILNDIEESKEVDDNVTARSESCYVYLMYDEANGYYKIGISNHPKYREHTLQSEKPTIVLVQAKQFPVRQIAEAYESALHKSYESKRLRGEWFKLDSEDIENLKKALI